MNLQESIRSDLALFEEEAPSEEQHVMQILANFRELYQQIEAVDNGYVLSGHRIKTMREMYHAIIESHFSMNSGMRQGIPDLDGSIYDHPTD